MTTIDWDAAEARLASQTTDAAVIEAFARSGAWERGARGNFPN